LSALVWVWEKGHHCNHNHAFQRVDSTKVYFNKVLNVSQVVSEVHRAALAQVHCFIPVLGTETADQANQWPIKSSCKCITTTTTVLNR
jgi:hypothetical protein